MLERHLTCPLASTRCHAALWLIILFKVVAMVQYSGSTPVSNTYRYVEGNSHRMKDVMLTQRPSIAMEHLPFQIFLIFRVGR